MIKSKVAPQESSLFQRLNQLLIDLEQSLDHRQWVDIINACCLCQDLIQEMSESGFIAEDPAYFFKVRCRIDKMSQRMIHARHEVGNRMGTIKKGQKAIVDYNRYTPKLYKFL